MGKLKTNYNTGHGNFSSCNTLTTLWIAPKKTKGEKMDLGTFLTDSSTLWSSRRTNGDVAAADNTCSPGFMGR